MIGIGLRAQKGGAVAVVLSVTANGPQMRFSGSISTAAEGDRLSFEPYRVAFEMARKPQGGASDEAKAAVQEGRRRQDRLAADGLRAVAEAWPGPAVAALLVNRAGWITDLLDYSLGWAEHVPVAETLAVRDALRFAIAECGLERSELDEKSLPDHASQVLGLPVAEIDAQLKGLGLAVGKPWRKEQKLACLAAWVAALPRVGDLP